MGSKHKLLSQLCLFTDVQMQGMVKLPMARLCSKRIAKEPLQQLTDQDLSYLAMVDCLRDGGYTGSDPVYDLFSGNHPD